MELRPYNAHAALALRLKASDPRWAEVNALAERRARQTNPQCWFNWHRWAEQAGAEGRAEREEVDRQEHNLLHPLARSEPRAGDDLELN